MQMQFDQPLGPFARSTDEGSVMAGSLLGGRGDAGTTGGLPALLCCCRARPCSKDQQLLVAGLSPRPAQATFRRPASGGARVGGGTGGQAGGALSGSGCRFPAPCSGAQGLGRVPGWALGWAVTPSSLAVSLGFFFGRGFPGVLMVRKPPVSAGDVRDVG